VVDRAAPVEKGDEDRDDIDPIEEPHELDP